MVNALLQTTKKYFVLACLFSSVTARIPEAPEQLDSGGQDIQASPAIENLTRSKLSSFNQELLVPEDFGYTAFFAYLGEYITYKYNGNGEALSSLSIILRNAEKMHLEIITAFNGGCFKKDYELLLMYQTLFRDRTLDHCLEPHELRVLKEEIDDFNKQFAHYRFTKKHLTVDELRLFQKIATLNLIISNIILTKNFFHFTVIEELIDLSVVQPLEFLWKHKKIILTLAGIAVALGLAYYFLWDHEEIPPHPVILRHITNQEFSADQVLVRAQVGNTCGTHAAYNAWCFQQAQGDLERFNRLAFDQGRFQEFMTHAAAINSDIAHEGQFLDPIRQIMRREGALNDSVIFIEDIRDIYTRIQPQIIPDPLNPQPEQDMVAAVNDRLMERLEQFNARGGRIQFVLNTHTRDQSLAPYNQALQERQAASASADAAALQRRMEPVPPMGHWITVEAVKSPTQLNTTQFYVADSRNRVTQTEEQVLDCLNRLITNNPL